MIIIGGVSGAVHTFRSLLLRVNPVTFVANSQMLGLIYGNREIDAHVSSAAHAVFQTSQDALISLNGEGIIESLNPSATTIFGFTPEQMLGQSLKLLVNPETEGNGTLFSTMDLMKTGQAGLVYEANVIGTKDDGTRVPLKMTLLGFASNGRTADTFAVMCKDQTEEVTQKTAVKEAKKQSENLLMQILPQDIILRLNRGDRNISFTVPSATIVFMDIEKFSNYSANLSPSELMKNLGEVFTAYDKLLPKFPLVLKIKLIGDDYMAAGGLFNPEQEPAAHANQVVQFALECLDAIEDLNEQLNASLQVRIGVNTGGPIIAGVLGTDKPLFDIIGDPINIAARLQSTDIPGFVQVSQDTYDKIAGGPFQIDQRGEIELKGKGKRMTYVVHPRGGK
jgi:PAS domain S-box-containing protein